MRDFLTWFGTVLGGSVILFTLLFLGWCVMVAIKAAQAGCV